MTMRASGSGGHKNGMRRSTAGAVSTARIAAHVARRAATSLGSRKPAIRASALPAPPGPPPARSSAMRERPELEPPALATCQPAMLEARLRAAYWRLKRCSLRALLGALPARDARPSTATRVPIVLSRSTFPVRLAPPLSPADTAELLRPCDRVTPSEKAVRSPSNTPPEVRLELRNSVVSEPTELFLLGIAPWDADITPLTVVRRGAVRDCRWHFAPEL